MKIGWIAMPGQTALPDDKAARPSRLRLRDHKTQLTINQGLQGFKPWQEQVWIMDSVGWENQELVA